MTAPSILRLRRFGSREAADAALAAAPDRAAGDVRTVQAVLDGAHGPFSSPLIDELTRLGWRTSELILGVPEVRAAWEREHGRIPPHPGIADPDVLLALAEARRFSPDVVLDSNLNVLDPLSRAALRRLAPSVQVTAGYMGTEKRFHRAVPLDLVLVPCRTMADAFAPYARGRVAVLPHSFDPQALGSLPPRAVVHPLVFAGALGPRYVERHRVLMALLHATDLEAWIGLRKGVERSADGWLRVTADAVSADLPRARQALRSAIVAALPTRLLARLAARLERLGDDFNARLVTRAGGELAASLPMRDPSADFPERCHPPVSGVEYLQLLRSSGTVVHRGIDALGDCGGALRLFEVTGAGAALLVEDSPTVRALFEVGEEVVTYTDPDDAVRQARWLGEHPEERERIALAGQARTLRDHTAAARARSLDPLLREALGHAGRRRGA
jgi:spore maturation protein CgeB